MPWWFRTIFLTLLLSFLAGLLIGVIGWVSRRRREAERYERLRLDREAESDRLRMRIASLQGKEERVVELESEVAELRDRAERLIAIQGQLSDAQRLANRVPELERQIIDLRHRGEQADRLENEVAKLRQEAARSKDNGELAALRASASRATELEQELAAVEASVQTLTAELEACRQQPGGVTETAEVLSPVDQAEPSPRQERTTELGTPGADHRDDLKAINGIGPVMERTLNGFGIQTWEQIAAFTTEDIQKVSAAISTFPGRIERDDWVGGAKELLAAGHIPGEDTSARSLTRNRRRK